MHEIGVLRHIARTVNKVAEENQIDRIKYITLVVGMYSGYMPYYLKKLFPIAADGIPQLAETEIIVEETEGKDLVIKDIGY